MARSPKMAKYRAAVIGLGWMGLLYDLGNRMGKWHVDDVDRPIPEDLDIHRKFYTHEMHLGRTATSYSETLSNRPEVDLVAAAERDKNRLAIFGERYNVSALYTDATKMLQNERPDIVAISSNVKGRADLTCLAVEHGAKGIMTEKPIAYTLAEADMMVKTCADAGVPLVCGAISTNHPSFATAKTLVTTGAIGDVVSIEAESDNNLSQHQNWSYFVDSTPAWVIGIGDQPKRESGSNEFRGQGLMVTSDDQMIFFRKGAPAIRITGSSGEIIHRSHYSQWTISQDIETTKGISRVAMPWPGVQMDNSSVVTHGFSDIFNYLSGRIDMPKNAGIKVATALEVEIGIKLSSARGGARVELPLKDRSIGLEYDWHR